ncbi:methyltransferase-like protein 5 [Cimex lectularius]|uniref:Uncharacterized protein n=1 Tax=Cimex lectularius TaxID=79782 RepID=A0A8I6RIJ6_CIMLE|nr:methyltransferase-like protein 5 [Cimex lectularius]XP_014242748.1 methyltransferase-like protein 5 [Cimex lectularius]
MKLKELESYLQEVEVFDKPKIHYEQYTTTPHLTTMVLHAIHSQYDDIEDKVIADLGCGCGILSIGASLLGAGCCIGFEIDDDAIEIFNHNVEYIEVPNCHVVRCDVTTGIPDRWNDFFDTVIMNPPFGTRKNGVDIEFLETAIRMGKVVYSMHKTSTREYIIKKCRTWQVECDVIAELKFDLPQTYKFHNKKSVDVHVDVIKFTRNA